MDVANFLKIVPGAIGLAGLLTLLTRTPKPASGAEFVSLVENLRDSFLAIGCVALILLSAWLVYRPAPPDHDTRLAGGPLLNGLAVAALEQRAGSAASESAASLPPRGAVTDVSFSPAAASLACTRLPQKCLASVKRAERQAV